MLANERVTLHTRLGFTGLGYLGSPIARRLIAAGFPMVVYNRDRAKAAPFAALGAEVAQYPQELAQEVDVVMSCLTDGAAVEAVYLGEGNVLRSARRGTRIVEMSTIAPKTSLKLHLEARQLDLSMLDVAVSGSAPAAEAGVLTLFGGGDRKIFQSAEPIFASIATRWFYMGPGGSGVAMKLVVNTLLGIGMQAVAEAEAVALGSRLGLPPDLLFDTLAQTDVVAPAHAGKLATAKRQDYTPQFPIRLMHNDFGPVLAAAAELGLPMPATEAAAIINAEQAATGGEEDFSAVIRRMEELAEAGVLLPAA
jgi:3-hydroxyisobutyrate dehydrogenase